MTCLTLSSPQQLMHVNTNQVQPRHHIAVDADVAALMDKDRTLHPSFPSEDGHKPTAVNTRRVQKSDTRSTVACSVHLTSFPSRPYVISALRVTIRACNFSETKHRRTMTTFIHVHLHFISLRISKFSYTINNSRND